MRKILALLSACGTFLVDVSFLTLLAMIWLPFGVFLLALQLTTLGRLS